MEDLHILENLVDKEIKKCIQEDVWYRLTPVKSDHGITNELVQSKSEISGNHCSVTKQRLKQKLKGMENYIRKMNKDLEVTVTKLNEDLKAKDQRIKNLMLDNANFQKESHEIEIKFVVQENENYELKRNIKQLEREKILMQERELFATRDRDYYKEMLLEYIGKNMEEINNKMNGSNLGFNNDIISDKAARNVQDSMPLAANTQHVAANYNISFALENEKLQDKTDTSYLADKTAILQKDQHGDDIEYGQSQLAYILRNAENIQKEIVKGKAVLKEISNKTKVDIKKIKL